MQGTANKVLLASAPSRIGAAILDGLIIAVPTFVVASVVITDFDLRAIAEGSNSRQLFYLQVVGQVLQATYAIVLVSLFQATLGKMAFGIRIIKADGERLFPDTAILRYLVFLVGNLLYSVEAIVSLVLLFRDPARRTIHDRIARTLVVRLPREGEATP